MAGQYAKHYQRILSKFPVDRLRPQETQRFQRLLQSRISSPPADNVVKREVNAGYLLLDNTFTRQFPLPEAMMKPASAPEHYTQLARELDEAPDRTWLGNLAMRLKNMVRMR